MGENTAACLAGVLSFQDCIDLVLLRGQLFDSVPPGGMLSVPLSADKLAPLLGDDLDIAALNAPDLTAVSGPQAALDGLQARLVAQDVDCQRIAIDIAAHSRMLDPILAQFRAFLARIDLNPPQIPFLSNRTGTYITDAQATDPDYWVDHLRHTVRFADCIATLATDPDRVYLEVGPGKALSSLAQMHVKVSANQVLSSLRHPDQTIADDLFFLGVIGRLWATGVSADWGQIWGEAKRYRVPLPTYAFQRSRYFIEPGARRAGDDAPALVRQEDIAKWGYRPVWRKRLANCDIDLEDDHAAIEDQTWLVFADDTGVGADVIRQLHDIGHSVVEVRTGDTFARLPDGTYTVSPEDGRQGYDLLIRDLVARGLAPSRIAHFWLVTAAETHRPGSSFFDRNQECGFYSLLHLAQAIGDEDLPRPLHISVVTNGAAQVRNEPLPYPDKATIAGPCGVIPRELPGVTCALLDIDLETATGKGIGTRFGWGDNPTKTNRRTPLIARLIEDLLATPSNTTAAYRGDTRYEQTLQPSNLPVAKETAQPAFRDGGVYMITGGFGGIGISISETLIREHHARVILLSRHPLPDRSDWPGYLLRHGPFDKTSRRIRDLQRLEALGGDVMVATADVCNPDEMSAAVQSARARFGAIDGVLHAAGTIDDAPLLAKTQSRIEAVLAPKIHGTRVLDALFPDGALDLLVLFSSTSTVTKPAGQIDYVAANEFLNAFAKARHGGKTRVVAVNWGVWAEIGMAADAVAGCLGQCPGAPVEPANQPLLDTATFDTSGNRIFETQLSTRSRWILDEHRTAQGNALMPGTGYLELAAEALAAQGETGPFSVQDLYFLRPLDVDDDAIRDMRVRLTPDETGYEFEVLSDCTVNGRRGFQTNAKGTLLPGTGASATNDRVDLAAIKARTTARTPADLRSPQEAHLAFGPRWRVLKDMRFGATEGLGRLSLPVAARSDLRDGYLLHPALLDIATGWAMELAPGYSDDTLWVPVSYRRVTVLKPLPADIFSWVRIPPTDSSNVGFATFDVTICDPDRTPCVEIEGFMMKRLENARAFATPAPVDLREIEFDQDAAQTQPVTAAEERLAYIVSQGIRPTEGPDALVRALATGQSQIVVSSLDLAALIRQADATITADAAPRQTFERPDGDTDYVAPSTEIEKTLVGFWQDLLGVAKVGVEDSFFDLGGHSLIAVRLFSKIKKTYQVEFPISVLFEAPTIATCAAMIAERTGADASGAVETAAAPAHRFSHLVPMHEGKGGPGTPMFMVAGMFGNVLNLRHLAHLIGPERPFYGLQARGLLGDAAPHHAIPQAASDYIAELKAVQPTGPYLIGGFSGGGITALEMAQQLVAAGDEVAMLVMLDTPLPVRPALSRRDKALIKLQEVRRKGPKYLLDWLGTRLRWELEKRRGADVPAGQSDLAHFHDVEIEAAFRTAVADYRPRPWSGPLTLFRPPLDRHWPVSNGHWVSRAREYVYPDNDWTRWIPCIDVQEVPGDHDSMVLEPGVRVLARSAASLPRRGRAARNAISSRGTRLGARHSSGVTIITDPTLLTIVLNYRTPALTLQAAEAALREMDTIVGELTIVDNDSGDGSYETLLAEATARGWIESRRVRVIQSGHNGGFGAGNNVGIRAGLSTGDQPDYVYILNSDAFPDAGAIRMLLDYLQADQAAGLAGSFLHGPDGLPHSTAFRFPSIAGEFEGAACTGVISRLLVHSMVALPQPARTQRVDWLAGASVMMRRTMLDQIGLFDEGFFLYFEETELCHRAARAGWSTVYVRESTVMHIGSASTGMKSWDRTPGYWFESRMRYFVKMHGGIYAAVATMAHIAGTLLYRTRRLVSDKPRVDPRHFLRDFIWHALRAVVRPRDRGAVQGFQSNRRAQNNRHWGN